jgi:hypothetical protein
MRCIYVCSAIALSLVPGAALADYTMEQQSACMGDAFRLCSEFIPNQDAVAHCMHIKHRDLSRPCRIVFDSYRPNSRPAQAYGAKTYPAPGYKRPGDSQSFGFGYHPPDGNPRPSY